MGCFSPKAVVQGDVPTQILVSGWRNGQPIMIDSSKEKKREARERNNSSKSKISAFLCARHNNQECFKRIDLSSKRLPAPARSSPVYKQGPEVLLPNLLLSTSDAVDRRALLYNTLPGGIVHFFGSPILVDDFVLVLVCWLNPATPAHPRVCRQARTSP